ncbi:MAG: peroxiredoxin [Proteobacteria bacterium]|nr:peroxiredoxin [Pseudomonadota bacterium]MDA1238179.1 peroxiredoxin [Pseudomonadota bacterium]
MVISIGNQLPNSKLKWFGETGIESINLDTFTRDKTVIIFGLPGAFTSTCHTQHVPSFIRTKPQFDLIGVDSIICISVNDPHVMRAWGEATGATSAGLIMLGDPLSEFTRSIGMDFDAPDVGFIGRSKRYSMLVKNNQVVLFNEEESRSQCQTSSGEELLDKMRK